MYKLIIILSLIAFNFTYSQNLKGWDYLVNKLSSMGIDKDLLIDTYSDPRMPEFSTVHFRVRPKESKNIYKGFYSDQIITKAVNYIIENKYYFDKTAKEFNVNPFIIASILSVETKLGTYTGNFQIFNRLSRVCSVRKPGNLEKSVSYNKKLNITASINELNERAKYLENMFCPELLALFEMKQSNNTEILNIKGSKAGAFGYAQFIPTSYLKFGIDLNNDKQTSLFSTADSIGSIANFIKYYGWDDNLTQESKEKVIWNYNRSDAYTNTVVNLEKLIKKSYDNRN